MPNVLFLVLAVVLLAAGTAVASSYEEPDYRVLESRDGYEIRAYAPHIVAEVTTRGAYRDAGNAAFRLLADYIFGGNTARDGDAPEPMSMTVPVTGTPQDEGEREYVWTFYMEGKYTLDTLPVPNDDRVRLVEVPARTVAVRKYRGRFVGDTFRAQREQLRQDLERDGLEPVGPASSAGYDGPWVPGPLKRNEVLQPVRWER